MEERGCGPAVAAAGLRTIADDITELRNEAKERQDEHTAAKYAHQLNCLNEAIGVLNQQEAAAMQAGAAQANLGQQPPPHLQQQQQYAAQGTAAGATQQPTGTTGADPNLCDWQCPACGNMNWPRRDKCNRCTTPKPAPGAQTAVMQAPGGKGGKGPDWPCPSCGNQNWGWRPSCNRCGTPKGPAMQPGGMMMQQQMQAMGGYAAQGVAGYDGVPQANPVALGIGGGAGRGPAPRAGDWQCPGCGNNNFARRDTCNRCGSTKGTAEELGGWGPGGASNVQTVPY
eukprot:TRINITY_DN2091_c0_g2_i1.p1 TRINITY_DN2091_c0_g2~~TRINITY_DN2091_c0_g2_i1.p1  ORF type:complete len:284 (+),score=84.47 TRINITY_DN2091_c0_g2_i1:97-948(+)